MTVYAGFDLLQDPEIPVVRRIIRLGDERPVRRIQESRVVYIADRGDLNEAVVFDADLEPGG